MAATPAEQERARREWRALRERLAAITPRSVGRGLLAATVVAGAAWLSVATWPALLPFAIGGVLAYMVLPLVNVLDRIMPRALAAILGMLLAVGAVIAIFAIILPPFARTIGTLSQELPTREQIAAWIDDLQASVGGIEGVGPQLSELVGEIVVAVRDSLQSSTGDVGGIARAVVQGAVGAVATAIGLVVLPAWILTVMRDQPAGSRSLRERLGGSLRPDGWAMVRMLDRVAADYLRSRVWQGLLVGGGVWLGMELARQVGAPSVENAVPLGVFAGAMQLIPEIGPIVALVPVVLALPISLELAVIYLGVYLASRMATGWVLGLRGTNRRRLHPAIMVPGIVLLSQFGIAWLFLAGPVLTLAYDIIRYTHGRLSEPPAPAGVIPDEATVRPATTVPARRTLTQRKGSVTANG
jgi:predicted PurR-regulated permease PerM